MDDAAVADLDLPKTSSPRHLTTSIQTLSLHYFRNYDSVRIEASPDPVVLIGHNGAGKTNILEAISLLTPGRGLRRARLSDIDKNPSPLVGEGGEHREPGEGGSSYKKNTLLPNPLPQGERGLKTAWAIAAQVSGMQGEVKIGTGRDPDATGDGGKRMVRIDGKTIRGQAELARHLAVIWLTPQMEQLFNEGTSAARKFLDRLVYSFDAEHASRINEYEYAMRERNKLLSFGRNDEIWLDALEQTMAETGAAIASARLHTAEHINHAIAASDLSFPKAHVNLQGFLEEKLQNGMAAIDAEQALKHALYEGRREDRAAGRALVGPHRTRMKVFHIEKQMVAENCSMGEQKALLLSIVLAQARCGMQWHGVVPVLLLDEIASHLDPTRRLELFEEICQIGAQTWMTGTDASLFAELKEKAQVFRVENGKIFL